MTSVNNKVQFSISHKVLKSINSKSCYFSTYNIEILFENILYIANNKLNVDTFNPNKKIKCLHHILNILNILIMCNIWLNHLFESFGSFESLYESFFKILF